MEPALPIHWRATNSSIVVQIDIQTASSPFGTPYLRSLEEIEALVLNRDKLNLHIICHHVDRAVISFVLQLLKIVDRCQWLIHREIPVICTPPTCQQCRQALNLNVKRAFGKQLTMLTSGNHLKPWKLRLPAPAGEPDAATAFADRC